MTRTPPVLPADSEGERPPMRYCCGDQMHQVFKAGGPFKGWYCEHCGDFEPSLFRERLWRQ